jgi:hypothetical protein
MSTASMDMEVKTRNNDCRRCHDTGGAQKLDYGQCRCAKSDFGLFGVFASSSYFACPFDSPRESVSDRNGIVFGLSLFETSQES